MEGAIYMKWASLHYIALQALRSDKALQSMNRKHSFQRASRCHRFYQSCIKANFLAFCKRLLTSGQPTALARKWCKNTRQKFRNIKGFFFKLSPLIWTRQIEVFLIILRKKSTKLTNYVMAQITCSIHWFPINLIFMKSSLVYASPNILDASSKEDVAVAMVLRGNGYNNEDKDRCDEFFQSLLSSSFSKRLLVTRPQHLLTVHFRYGFHELH